jgi:hypothetical protein
MSAREAELACDPKLSAYLPMEMDAFVLQMSTKIWAQEVATYRYEWPHDWWQAVRQRWLPAWWLAKHPVKMHVERVDVLATYPTFKPPDGLKNHPVVWKVRDGSWFGGREYRTVED